MSGLIKSWSISRLADFEACPYRAKLKIIDKIPEPERPLPPGKTEHANDRGTRIHAHIEQYVNGTIDSYPVEAVSFEAEIKSLREKYKKGKVSLEGEWGFDQDWKPCAWGKAWARVKCDAVVELTKSRLLVLDHKTGRKFGNEVKHAEQVQFYAMCAALKFPEVKMIDVELWYLDQDECTHESKGSKQWLYPLKLFTNRGLKMTNATNFPPNPSGVTCKWCPYKNGICEFAATDAPAPRRKPK